MSVTQTAQPERSFVTEAARHLHNEVVHAKEKLSNSAFSLGGALARMQDEKAYTALGFDTFEDYLEGPEVAIHRTTAYKFIRVFRAFQHVAHGLHGRYDMQKLDIVGKLIDPDMDPAQVEALIEEARPLPREELRARVNAAIAARATPRAVAPPAQLDTPLVREHHERAGRFLAGLGAAYERQEVDPEYVALNLIREAFDIHRSLNRLPGRNVRQLIASTPPEEMARIVLGDNGLGSSIRRDVANYEREIKPVIAWYEEVLRLLNDPPATIRRVK